MRLVFSFPASLSRTDSIICLLLPFFLAADMLNGVLLRSYGFTFGISAVYKVALLLLMLSRLVQGDRRSAIILAILLSALLPGPLFTWWSSGHAFLHQDVQLAIKLIAALVAFFYFRLLLQQHSDVARTLLHNTMACSYLLLLINFTAGILGMGYAAYRPMDDVEQAFLGIKGFFYSTNELSALLLVLTAYWLYYCWQFYKIGYLLISILSVAMALLLLTKTGLFGTLLLIVFIPVLMIPVSVWRTHRKGVLIAGVITAICAVLFVVYLPVILKVLGIYDKINYVYQNKGITGILLSSRDLYATRLWQVCSEFYSDLHRFFGVGVGGIRLHLKKYFSESDLFDVIIFYGIAGVTVFVATFGCFIKTAWSYRQNAVARVVLFLNLLMLLISVLAGHVLTSGMLWLPWAIMNAIAVTGMQTKQE